MKAKIKEFEISETESTSNSDKISISGNFLERELQLKYLKWLSDNGRQMLGQSSKEQILERIQKSEFMNCITVYYENTRFILNSLIPG